MSTHRKKEFEAFWQDYSNSSSYDPLFHAKDHAWATWQKAADIYSNQDCQERIRQREAIVSSGYERGIQKLKKEADKWCLEASIRKEVHRDDYVRSATMLSALKSILQLSVEGSPIYETANQAIMVTWGISSTKHCDHHSGYRATCPDCIQAGRSQARGHDLEG